MGGRKACVSVVRFTVPIVAVTAFISNTKNENSYAMDQVKECIGREMLACFGSNNGHGQPHHENITSFKSGGYFRIRVYERPVQLTQ